MTHSDNEHDQVPVFPKVTVGLDLMKKEEVVRIIRPETIQPDLTAKELAQLMFLEVTFTSKVLSVITPEQRELVERHSRPCLAM